MTKKLSFYKDLFENSSDMIAVADHRTQKIIECNQTLLDSLEYTREELLSLPSVAELYHPQCHKILKSALKLYTGQGCLTNLELILKTKSGNMLPVSLNVSEIKDEKGNLAFFRNVYRDISEFVKADSDIAEQVKNFKRKCQELEKRNQDLDTFTHLVAHDLREPLRSINFLTALMKEDHSNTLSAESKKCLLCLEKMTHKMNDLMNDIIFYFLLDRDAKDTETVNLKDFIATILEIMSIPAGFNFKIQSHLRHLTIKKLPLQQVLYNLLNNALKHHHHPSRGEVRIKVEDTKEHYVFHISDNGPGIPVRFQDYIFQAFKTLKNQGDDEGSGLGLTIVKKIVAQEGGEISLSTCEQKGTTFTLNWPKLAT